MGKKPGEMALEALKKMNDKVSVFKIPSAPQTKKSRMKILTEEKYIEVSAITLIYYVELSINSNGGEQFCLRFSI